MIDAKYNSSLDRLPGDDLWAKMINSCENIEGLSKKEIKESQDAFKVLQNTLGINFLEMVFSKNHPMTFNLINVVAWTRRWIIWLAKAIDVSLNYDKKRSILKRLKDPDKYYEGLSVLKYADKLSRMGFEISIDEMIGKKVPDIKVINKENGETFVIEVSIQKRSVHEEKAFEIMRSVTFAVFCSAPGMSYCGGIYKYLADKHLADVICKVKDIAVSSKSNNLFKCLHIPYILDFAIAPSEDDPKLINWAKRYRTQPGQFSGPDDEVNHFRRLEAKVFKEQEQLPIDKPGIIIIESNDLFRTRDYRGTISRIEDIVYKYDKLAVLIISGSYIGSGSNVIIQKEGHKYIGIKKNDLLFEQYYFIKNKYCNHKLSKETLDKIIKSLKI
ncbi:MAG: hypothetical protein A2509_03085 [Candidatus Edwardsbacteria bacterium RIFOXYD12_FULL_50_11]|uniref:Uncharacterized protein n=1 Tax=Candidatus Edwardsbacteria bacterium GWF2_54_11 TaxID=1817851 RepID=A0A1F5RI50_9BACT|nr:MAG: hypothetical protein A2502_06950 [Candidatus Edwardsbacteria bacterium RifOxyC12_full_54_24]OGF06967.1 MAG: hypothetical protein A2273_08480 [Candidatus Edwardsbacteria bacterium RifOxyA12_full_54_48]OGF11067.1 MAG: hypothetical protein A3K15_08030 [Candidatus Edwardsbacteria bacterium GWE2_54_12]OGF14034.1 MAG: hypothetical protein A2024_05735 [Candidatus Edwardsbacteria bacterium GWF2_54_11]OGF16013.1 MAG: hypothetical protein A2509_03085 [Candidatus Edwardsbacteria bacterium RIFOXYD1